MYSMAFWVPSLFLLAVSKTIDNMPFHDSAAGNPGLKRIKRMKEICMEWVGVGFLCFALTNSSPKCVRNYPLFPFVGSADGIRTSPLWILHLFQNSFTTRDLLQLLMLHNKR